MAQPRSRREKHFCNQSCYFRWRYMRGDLKRTVYEKVCAYCGKPFTVESNIKIRYDDSFQTVEVTEAECEKMIRTDYEERRAAAADPSTV